MAHFTNMFALPPADASWWVMISTVGLASVVGSPHCMGMCGPLAAGVSRSWTQNLFYNLGRGISYISLGAAFGALGQWLFSFSSKPWRYGVTAVMITLVLTVGWSIYSGRALKWPMPKAVQRFHWQIYQFLFKKDLLGDTEKALLAGLLTVGLPCGWLFTFVGLASASGTIERGVAILLAFWMGTLPAMTVVPSLLGRVFLITESTSRKVAGVLVVSSSAYVIISKWATVAAHAAGHCH